MNLYPAPARTGQAANVSAETHAVTDAVIAWGRKRWPGARVIRELVLGERRIDLVFVMESDLAGVEIKGPKDSLDRLKSQMSEYGYWLPQIFVALDEKFESGAGRLWLPNKLWVSAAGVDERDLYNKGQRDDLCCSRLLDLLWRDEAAAIAVRTNVIPTRVPKQFNRAKVLSMLARLLTGHEIVKEVCRELRARQLVGMGSDAPMRTGVANAEKTDPSAGRGQPAVQG